MYIIWFLHRVPREREEAFRGVVYRAIELLKKHGAIGATMYEIADPDAKYGCGAIADEVDVADDEVLYAEIAYFHDKANYDEVMATFDHDPELMGLYDELVSTVDISRVLRAEFSSLYELVDPERRLRHDRTEPTRWAPV